MESKPVFELHKLSEGYIVTSDEQIKEGDSFYRNTGVISVMNKELSRYYESIKDLSAHNEYKLIAQQDQIDFSALSEEEQKEIGWFDVEKYIDNLFKDEFEIAQEAMPAIWYDIKLKAIQTFQKAQELLSDRRFTLDEVRQSFWKCCEIRGLGYSVTMGDLEVELSKSLSQWKVELEMEKETLYTDDGLDYKRNLIVLKKLLK
jgi:hypothetical protein